MAKKFTVALLISTYNWPEALQLVLLSILQQTVMPDEVLIADDGSGPETQKLIAVFTPKFSIPVKHAWHEDKGFRKTIILNKAIRISTSDYIVQIDGDIILDKDFLFDHIHSAEKNTFIRGTRALLTPKKTIDIIRSCKIHLSAFSLGVKHRNNAFRLFPFRRLGVRKEKSAKSVRGSNLAFWKDDFVKINGYNNELAGWGHEDEELAVRFINNGMVKKIVKLVAIQYHLHHASQSKSKEPAHQAILEKMKTTKSLFCENGYNQVYV